MTSEGPPIGAGVPETPDRDGAFPRLGDDLLARFRSLGEVRAVQPGEVLFASGDQPSHFFIVESGLGGDRPGLRGGEPGDRDSR